MILHSETGAESAGEEASLATAPSYYGASKGKRTLFSGWRDGCGERT